MKSFMEWFKASTKVKRWILLILVGVALTCYAFTKILVSEEITFFELGKTILIFVLGFMAIVISVVFIQKRSLEIIIEANNTSTEKGKQAQLNIKSLIFNKKVYEEGPKVVVIGGGTGLNIVLEGFKKYTNNITAIVTMSDYGNVPTASRKALDTLPLKDIKDSIIAMSDKEDIMRKLMYFNFQNERLRGLNFGDIYLTAMNEIYNNISEAILKSTEVLNITGRVMPVTLDELTICAELSDGTTVKQKDRIPQIVAEKVESINRVYISPSNCRPSPGVLDAIEDADVIIIGPGSLYTNVLPNLLVKNVSRAIRDSKAMKFYISNIMTEPGQTDNYTLSDHLKAINEHVGTDIIDYCLADTGEVVPEYIRKYNKDGSDLVEIDSKKINEYNVRVIQRNMSCIKNERIRHKSDVIASTIIEMICNDLKFHDMQNNTEYLLLQSVLKDQKKLILKEEKRKKKLLESGKLPKKETDIKRNSKFKEKYRDRVESIQNTEAKIKENRRIAEEIEKMEKAKMAASSKRKDAPRTARQEMPKAPKRRK
ncbi:MAG: uridine diphosphate-N-acetylglucosamine-binding protein YvcK [Clostridia bacterium]|nr:uridine diphosphate-N-acetylglucosamine-binding protein YvcK [Clostridia bacterium]